jgi:hypothetical protein
VSCRAGLNRPTTGPDRTELNGPCRARPTGCRPGPSMVRLVLRAGPDPLPVAFRSCSCGPNHAGRGPAHLPRAKFSGLLISIIPIPRVDWEATRLRLWNQGVLGSSLIKKKNVSLQTIAEKFLEKPSPPISHRARCTLP